MPHLPAFNRSLRRHLPVSLLALLWLPLAAGAVAAVADRDPRAPVTGGIIRGRRLPDGSGRVFRGVPFAQPPVGVLRWREPQVVQPWTGERDAGVSGPPAKQAAFGWNDAMAAASREDCLYLDVWEPEGLATA